MAKNAGLVYGSLAVLGYILYQGINDAKQTVKNLRFYVKKIAFPRITSGLIVFPLTLSLDNHSPSSVPVQNLMVTIHKLEGTGETFISSSQPDLSAINIRAHATTNLDIEMKAEPLVAAKEIYALLTKKGQNTYRILVETTISGITIPYSITQRF
ncbi:hypothetical protein [Adhaeribacter pallidiroseus]|uniref:Late embryogenesis abundant protein LEA-2 subgroup domain-containing protein n=1 Tax=Adhaeribacter pallidiroseus TaxID=2072847 RepID=A0A369QN01_9BACT|nr:hypothetical protein [Adhaeribacter pallidiroseus]RDC65055.1 hypothetical protein AHMF7616_03678 [Adhaeribacter pallidiroseus]